jgi:hypothetical protein
VREHIEGAGNDPVNLPELVGKVGESLVDLIMLGPEEQWGNLLAGATRAKIYPCVAALPQCQLF